MEISHENELWDWIIKRLSIKKNLHYIFNKMKPASLLISDEMQSPELQAALESVRLWFPITYVHFTKQWKRVNTGGKPGRQSIILVLVLSVQELWLKQKRVTLTITRFYLLKDFINGHKWAIGNDDYKCSHKTPWRLLKLRHLQILGGSCLPFSSLNVAFSKRNKNRRIPSEVLNFP